MQEAHYYPFGLPIQKLSPNFEAPVGVEANNYQYNGKELNDDFGLQWMDYGARWYNVQIGRWGQIDPLAEKFYAWSGYNYVLGNPVKLIDPDGREGVAAIDQKNKTITIKAIYYTQTIPSNNIASTAYTSEQVTSMQSDINSTLNGLGLSVSEGQYEGFSVQFDLQFKEGGHSFELSSKAINEQFEGVPIGNTFQRGNEQTHPNLFTERENGGVIKVTGGVTQDHKLILMNEKYDSERNQIHEIFHTLFFDNDDAKKGIGSYSRNDLPNQSDINKLINNKALPKIDIENE
ncbi:MAG: RHS repeat-associated core domain-containing protein [Sphingobacteriales bacterium]|nr:MAG: RHS repeat-associated core domain-containing protein [Sphingobacteriales bacterium]